MIQLSTDDLICEDNIKGRATGDGLHRNRWIEISLDLVHFQNRERRVNEHMMNAASCSAAISDFDAGGKTAR